MKFFKHTLIATLVASVLSACGGSGDSSSDSNKSHKIKAIDGYLIGAQVYVDRNQNGVAEADEKLPDLTDNSGAIAIADADKDYDIIIRAVAGQTRDSDKGGTIETSFDLVTSGSSLVATPFTTIARSQSKTIEQVALELGYDSEVMGQDYIVMKNDVSSAQEAKKVHLLARSIAPSLNLDLNGVTFEQQLTAVNRKVEDLAATSADLDQQIIYLSDTGVASSSSMPPTLAEFMRNSQFVSFSLNDFWRTRHNGDEFASWEFDYDAKQVAINGEQFTLAFDSENPNSFFMTMPPAQGEACEVPYQQGLCRSEMQDDLVLVEQDFAVALSVDGDLQTYVRPLAGENINYELAGFGAFDLTDSPITQNAYFHLDDTQQLNSNQPWKPAPQLTSMSKGSISSIDVAQGHIALNGVTHQVLRGNGQVYLIKRINDNHPSLLFRSEQLANLMLERWQNNKLVAPTEG